MKKICVVLLVVTFSVKGAESQFSENVLDVSESLQSVGRAVLECPYRVYDEAEEELEGTYGEVNACDGEELDVVQSLCLQKRLRQRAFSNKRVEALFAVFQDRKHVSYQCVYRRLYAGVAGGNRVFHGDVLSLLRAGEDMSVNGACVSYGGPMKLLLSPFSNKSVPEAMFDVISSGVKKIFMLQVAMYRNGFVQHSPNFLENLERALAVGGVHPHPKRCYKKEFEEMRVFWSATSSCSEEDFFEKLRQRKSQNGANILRLLWVLQQNGVLSILKRKMESYTLKTEGKVALYGLLRNLPCDAASHESVVAAHGLKGGVRSSVRDVDSVQALWELLKKKKTVAFREVEGLYDNLRPFHRAILKIMRWGADLSVKNNVVHYHGVMEPQASPERPVSYAMFDFLQSMPMHDTFQLTFNLYRQGYTCYSPGGLSALECALLIGRVHPWPRTLPDKSGHDQLGKLQTFWENSKHLPKKHLCEAADKQKMTVWKSALNKLLFLQDVKELSALEGMKADFCQKCAKEPDEGAVVRETLEGRPYFEKLVEDYVTEGPRSIDDLKELFKQNGNKNKDFFWSVLGDLAQRPQGGFLHFCLESYRFRWMRVGAPPHRMGEDYFLEAFTFREKHLGMDHHLFAYMMRQKGFKCGGHTDVEVVFGGFAVLGLMFKPTRLDKVDMVKRQRETLSLMLKERKTFTLAYYVEHVSPDITGWDMRVCNRVFSWISFGGVTGLWRAYLDSDVVYSEMRSVRPEQVVCSDLPILADFLRKGGCFVDPADSRVSCVALETSKCRRGHLLGEDVCLFENSKANAQDESQGNSARFETSLGDLCEGEELFPCSKRMKLSEDHEDDESLSFFTDDSFCMDELLAI